MAASPVSIFDSLDVNFSQETVSEICRMAGGTVRIERIVSLGQCSPPDFWYDQTEDEWVVLLTGQARLSVWEDQGRAKEVALGPGCQVYLPAHCRHRVEWTTPDEPTVWLAVFAAVPSEMGGNQTGAHRIGPLTD